MVEAPLKPAPSRSLSTRLAKVSDLPRLGKVLDLTALGFTPERADQLKNALVVWSLPAKQRNLRGSVWIVYTEDVFRQNMRDLVRVRQHLRDYEVVAEHTADSGQITKLYDQASQQEAMAELGPRNTDVNAFLDQLLDESVSNDASDIHIERRRMDSRIRLRMLGHLQTHMKEVSTEFISRVCRAVYNVEAEEEGKDVNFREDRPQASSIARTIKGQEYKLRFQSLPAYPDGYDVVLRILRVGAEGDMKYTTLEELGYSPDQILQIQEIVAKPIGVLIVAGVTGSGKSTTLKSLVMWINATRSYRCKIYSIEDPPEYRIPGITQMPVKQLGDTDDPTKIISPFHAPLKAAMRGDPDVIMIGEVRDNTTGDGIKSATQSGHQVLTTIHAPTSFGIFDRLRGFGLDLTTLGSDDFISGLIYQRLIPTLCQNCRINLMRSLQGSEAPSDLVELGRRLEDAFAGIPEVFDKISLQGPGCDQCRHLGIIGRTVCAEIVKPDSTMLNLIEQNRITEANWRWRQKSDLNPISTRMDGKTALEHALTKVAEGVISPVDVEVMMGRVNSAKQKYAEMREREALRREEAPISARDYRVETPGSSRAREYRVEPSPSSLSAGPSRRTPGWAAEDQLSP